jgi:diketogulonate reductase-like aldo/keto reductase
VVAVAGELDVLPSAVALAWLRARNPQIIPIVGAKATHHITDALGCLDVHLEEAHLARLNTISGIELGFPHDFLLSDVVSEVLYSGQRKRISTQGMPSRF